MSFLEINDLSKNFGTVKVLDHVTLSVRKGSVIGLVGDNGAGKTTLIKVIAGVYHPDNGSIKYEKKNIIIDNPRYARELGIETIYQGKQTNMMELCKQDKWYFINPLLGIQSDEYSFQYNF